MAVPLTADICAHAIVAAARCYGDDPVAAIGPVPNRGAVTRRSLTPAALAIIQATGFSRPRLCQILGIDYYGLSAVPKRPAPRAAWVAALDALGVDPASVKPSRFGPKAKPSPATTVLVVDNKNPAGDGTVVAPPPAAPEVSSPATPQVDHRPAIAEALARRRAQAASCSFEVVGVEADKAGIGLGGCCWPPKGVVSAMDDPTCDEKAVPGRLFCVDHCRAVGQKDTPVVLSTPDMPQRFAERQGAS